MNISFMTANYVARQVGYNMTEGWGQGDAATQKFFKPLKTFEQRFETYLKDIRAMGFDRLDLWVAILHPAWAKDEQIEIAQDLLKSYNLSVTSLAGDFGDTPELFEASCELASAFDTAILGGSTALLARQRGLVISTLQKYGLRLALENHPEKTPEAMLSKIGDGGDGTIGTTVDTGWYGTQGYDAAQAIEKLGSHVWHVHLKDVLKPGEHDTCRYGQGCVPVEACVQTLKRIGYAGAVSLEHEPEYADPTEDCIASLALLKGWLS